MKRLLIIGMLCLGCLTIYNLTLEWSLDITARKFANDLVKVKQDIVLRIAIKTYDWPRIYRKSNTYEDLHALVLCLLYLDTEKDTQKAIWGIRTAVHLLDKRIPKYPNNSEEQFFSRMKRVSIINRMPNLFSDEYKNVNQEIESIILSSKSTAGVPSENIAYIYIEKMFYEANTGVGKLAIDQSFADAIKHLGSGTSEIFSAYKSKFEFYYGYAKCLGGDKEGGQLMLDSFVFLSQNSTNFGEAMLVNWDWPLIGTLRSVKSSGYAACHEAAETMKQ